MNTFAAPNAPSAATRTLALPDTAEISPAQSLLWDFLNSAVVPQEQWDLVPADLQKDIKQSADTQALLARLVEHKLLTRYQAERIAAYKAFGLILGNYRVLDRLGAGGMG